MTCKENDMSYFKYSQWLNDLPFLIDVTKYLSELNLKLQEKYQLAYQQFENTQEFNNKINLLQTYA